MNPPPHTPRDRRRPRRRPAHRRRGRRRGSGHPPVLSHQEQQVLLHQSDARADRHFHQLVIQHRRLTQQLDELSRAHEAQVRGNQRDQQRAQELVEYQRRVQAIDQLTLNGLDQHGRSPSLRCPFALAPWRATWQCICAADADKQTILRSPPFLYLWTLYWIRQHGETHVLESTVTKATLNESEQLFDQHLLRLWRQPRRRFGSVLSSHNNNKSDDFVWVTTTVEMAPGTHLTPYETAMHEIRQHRGANGGLVVHPWVWALFHLVYYRAVDSTECQTAYIQWLLQRVDGLTTSDRHLWSTRFGQALEGATQLRHDHSVDGYVLMMATLYGDSVLLNRLIFDQHRFPDERFQQAWRASHCGQEDSCCPSYWTRAHRVVNTEFLVISHHGSRWRTIPMSVYRLSKGWKSDSEIERDTRELEQALDHKSRHDTQQCACDTQFYAPQPISVLQTNLETVQYNVFCISTIRSIVAFHAFPSELLQCLYAYLAYDDATSSELAALFRSSSVCRSTIVDV